MDFSVAANLLTAVFTGITAIIAVHNHFKHKPVCNYYRTLPFDRSNKCVDHQYIIEIVNHSYKTARVVELCVPHTVSPNINFERMELKSGETGSCRVAFYTENDDSTLLSG